MATTNELLNELLVNTHEHPVTDNETRFVIDPFTRVISNASENELYLMQYDHNSEIYTFELPRYVDGHDMLLCNSVKVHFNNIEAETGTENADVAEITDLQVDPEDSSKVICSWLVKRQSTQLAGILSFLVQYLCTTGSPQDDDFEVVYEWHTDIFSEVTVKPGRNNGDVAIDPPKYSNILEQWESSLFGVRISTITDLLEIYEQAKSDAETIVNNSREAITAHAETVKESIPDEYEETSNNARKALRTRANAIVKTAEGSVISVNDASDDYLRGLRVFGKSTQGPDPSPENPEPIVSIENSTVNIYGKNLLNTVNTTKTANGVTFTVNSDKTVTINGTSTESTFFNIDMDSEINYQGAELIVSLDGSTNTSYLNVGYFTEDAKFVDTLVTVGSAAKTFVYPDEAVKSRVYMFVNAATTFNNVTVRPMIRLATNENGVYEPYVESQTLTISHILPGIPVDSGGNYTDENGQQWICDEIDFERRMYVQRVKTVILDGSDDEAWMLYDNNAQQGLSFVYYPSVTGVTLYQSSLCDKYRNVNGCWGEPYYGQMGIYSDHTDVTGKYFRPPNTVVNSMETWKLWLAENPLTLMYILKTPIETPLDEIDHGTAELNAFDKLHSNYPITTVMNDQGAYVELKYNADTKAYIDDLDIPKIEDFMPRVYDLEWRVDVFNDDEHYVNGYVAPSGTFDSMVGAVHAGKIVMIRFFIDDVLVHTEIPQFTSAEQSTNGIGTEMYCPHFGYAHGDTRRFSSHEEFLDIWLEV